MKEITRILHFYRKEYEKLQGNYKETKNIKSLGLNLTIIWVFRNIFIYPSSVESS